LAKNNKILILKGAQYITLAALLATGVFYIVKIQNGFKIAQAKHESGEVVFHFPKQTRMCFL